MTIFNDLRQFAPATERNRQPILDVLSRVLPPRGTVLEVASGTGEHAVYFAPRLTPRIWQPSDLDPQLRASIAAWMQQCPSENLLEPIAIDASASVWSVETRGTASQNRSEINAIVAINLIHISPWETTLGLMAGCDRILPSGGILYLYGPYKRGGKHTAPSNESFDEMLRLQNPTWGVRDLEQVVALAEESNLKLVEIVEMPANNLSVVFERL